jgi:hypothetical protein
MNERRWWIVTVVAVTIMGLADFLRRQNGQSSALSTVLVVLEIVAIIVALVAIFSWVRLREKHKQSRKGS